MSRGVTPLLALVGTVVSSGVSAVLPDVAPDLGGVTFDFPAVSARLQAALAPPTANVLASEVTSGIVRRDASGNVGDVVRDVRLPSDRGVRYWFTCSYRRRGATGAWGGCLVQFREGGKTRSELVKMRMMREGVAWQTCAEPLDVPTGVDGLRLIFRLRGEGELSYRDLSLRPVPERSGSPVALEPGPTGRLDGRFAVSKGQCGFLTFGCRAEKLAADAWSRVSYALRLPKGFACLDTNFGADRTVETLSDGGCRVRGAVDVRKCPLPAASSATLGFLVTAEATAVSGVCTLTLERDGWGVSDEARVRLEPVEPVRAASVPRRYRNGLNVGADFAFREPAAQEAIVRLMGEAGAGWLIAEAGVSARLLPSWRKYAKGVVTPYSMALLKDGFRVGPETGRPEADRFVADDRGGPDAKHIRRATCPVAVYEERPFFRTNSLPALAAMAKGADGLWANWEPFRFEGRGCFCASCRKAFADFAHKSESEVAAAWPQALGKGGKWADLAPDFRSQEHARLVRTVDCRVRAMTGGADSVGFVPGVAWPELSSEWRRLGLGREVQEIAYAGALKWICPWGPYPAWPLSKPYAYDRRLALLPWCAARDVRAAVDRDYPAGARPRLMGFPQGVQGDDWVTQPESLAQALDAYFFNRWGAAVVYYFPHGYDARYWKAFAAATERAARYEDFVLDGRRADASCTVTPVPEYAVPVKGVSMYLPNCRDQSLLQTAAFAHGESVVVAVLNHWQRGEAYFNLQVRDLPADAYTVVADGVLWTKDRDRSVWTAEELEAGVRLMAGAARTVVFEICPAAENAVAHARGQVTQMVVRDLYETHRDALRRKVAAEAADEEARGRPASDGL